MKFTIFYAWQMDSPVGTNKHFISEALERAVKIVAADETLQANPRVDQDTRNVPGMAAITDTILTKIEDAAIFVGDLTYVSFVGQSLWSCLWRICGLGRGKPLPNPNVLLELGWAGHAIGWSRIICVMNTAWGQPGDDHVFDLRHRRFPISYELRLPESKESRKKKLEKLSAALASAIKEIVKSGVISRAEESSRVSRLLRTYAKGITNDRQRLLFEQAAETSCELFKEHFDILALRFIGTEIDDERVTDEPSLDRHVGALIRQCIDFPNRMEDYKQLETGGCIEQTGSLDMTFDNYFVPAYTRHIAPVVADPEVAALKLPGAARDTIFERHGSDNYRVKLKAEERGKFEAQQVRDGEMQQEQVAQTERLIVTGARRQGHDLDAIRRLWETWTHTNLGRVRLRPRGLAIAVAYLETLGFPAIHPDALLPTMI